MKLLIKNTRAKATPSLNIRQGRKYFLYDGFFPAHHQNYVYLGRECIHRALVYTQASKENTLVGRTHRQMEHAGR
jgi:hypothetical protein